MKKFIIYVGGFLLGIISMSVGTRLTSDKLIHSFGISWGLFLGTLGLIIYSLPLISFYLKLTIKKGWFFALKKASIIVFVNLFFLAIFGILIVETYKH